MARVRGNYLIDEYNESTLIHQEIIVEDDRPIDTGLLDANGVAIYRVRDRLPLGYFPRVKK